jgi:hypothetical protein
MTVPGNFSDSDFLRHDLAAKNAPVIDLDFRIEIDRTEDKRNDDERFLLQFFGACVLMIGLTTVVPAVWHWIVISQSDTFQAVPRWAWLLGFAGGLHCLYAFYVSQIEDYSALQSLAAFLLVVTCVYGFLGIALWLGDNNGVIARFLQVAAVHETRAAAWCGVMFGVSALGCYLFGREAVIWRRRIYGKHG